jgi:hypothetical protein
MKKNQISLNNSLAFDPRFINPMASYQPPFRSSSPLSNSFFNQDMSMPGQKNPQNISMPESNYFSGKFSTGGTNSSNLMENVGAGIQNAQKFLDNTKDWQTI